MKRTSSRTVALVLCAVLTAIAYPAWAESSPSQCQTADLRPWQLLVSIMLSGFFGGFVDGLRSDKSFKFRLGTTSKEWGSIGNALVGTVAAVAIFAFAESVFGAETVTASSMCEFTFLKVMAFAVLSGYAGTRLLDPLTEKMVKEFVDRATLQAVEQRATQDQVAAQNIREAEQAITQHLAMVAGLSKGVVSKEAEKLLVDAERKFELVLANDPASIPAQLGLANVYGYRGDYVGVTAPQDARQRADCYAKAINVLDALIKRAPNVAKAYYNRACCKAVAGKDKDSAAADLARAVELDPHFKEYARGDKDLDSLRDQNGKLPFEGKT
jgi:Tfp pilus assembly protein PilF